jgi:hypothetical protein
MPVTIRKFHQAKGFNPDSQEVVLHVGHLLYQLSCDSEAIFTHGESAIPKQISVLI